MKILVALVALFANCCWAADVDEAGKALTREFITRCGVVAILGGEDRVTPRAEEILKADEFAMYVVAAYWKAKATCELTETLKFLQPIGALRPVEVEAVFDAFYFDHLSDIEAMVERVRLRISRERVQQAPEPPQPQK
jgi:hypothetical protein